MIPSPSPAVFAAQAEKELHEGMLKFWIDHSVDEQNGGFFGEVDAQGVPVPSAAKGQVLNARLVWTFSAAARLYPEHAHYRRMADRAHDYLMAHFVDKDHGGVFWSLDAQGQPLDTRKQVYGQAFTIYGLTEYYKLTQRQDVLDTAIELFELLEEHAMETTHGGYLESLAADWSPMEEMRLSPRDLEAPKSFNTNLHVMEAYANLYEVWQDPTLHDALADLVRIHLDHMFDETTEHIHLFFSNDWQSLNDVISYGHDIEAAWLLHWAAAKLEDSELIGRVQGLVKTIAESTLRDGIDPTFSGIFYEGFPDGRIDMDKHWWPQLESAVGFIDAWQLTGDQRYYDAAWNCWDFGMSHIKDPEVGEWHFRTDREGQPYPGQPKISFWKCPYHSSRACYELSKRLKADGQRLNAEGQNFRER